VVIINFSDINAILNLYVSIGAALSSVQAEASFGSKSLKSVSEEVQCYQSTENLKYRVYHNKDID